MTNKIDYEVSIGNVFEDMGLPNAQERLAKAKLASKIIEIAQETNWTQKKVANFLNIDQPKVSALYNGRLSGFSMSRLIKFLMLLAQDVDIVIKGKTDHYASFGHLTVISHDHVQARF
jgi:predicted XRE-type DNA-binding protein